MEYFKKAVRKSHEVSVSSIDRHRQIVAAIESKNPEKIEEAIIGMGKEWSENIEKYCAQEGIEPSSLLGK